ncbi:hypothetical protein [Halalkalibacter alkalisediminis]|uniref:Sin domain-containing protein n=1 Tax=Halalkalibacter alkalisediminis TaxID=935616 RepID=A0ABV6NKC3_9BACI|nr:hypothetical protein [Halalkalibacter alkalisediminis]
MDQKAEILDSGWLELIVAAKRLGFTYEEIKDYLQNHSSELTLTKNAEISD